MHIQSKKRALVTIEIRMSISLDGVSSELVPPRGRDVNKMGLVEMVEVFKTGKYQRYQIYKMM